MDSKSKFLFSGKVKVKGEWKTKSRKWQTAKRREFYLNAPPILLSLRVYCCHIENCQEVALLRCPARRGRVGMSQVKGVAVKG